MSCCQGHCHHSDIIEWPRCDIIVHWLSCWSDLIYGDIGTETGWERRWEVFEENVQVDKNEAVWHGQHVSSMILPMCCWKKLLMCWCAWWGWQAWQMVSANQMLTVSAMNSSTLICKMSGGSTWDGSKWMAIMYPNDWSSIFVILHMMLNCGHHPPRPSCDVLLRNMKVVSQGINNPMKHVYIVELMMLGSNMAWMDFKSCTRCLVMQIFAESQKSFGDIWMSLFGGSFQTSVECMLNLKGGHGTKEEEQCSHFGAGPVLVLTGNT